MHTWRSIDLARRKTPKCFKGATSRHGILHWSYGDFDVFEQLPIQWMKRWDREEMHLLHAHFFHSNYMALYKKINSIMLVDNHCIIAPLFKSKSILCWLDNAFDWIFTMGRCWLRNTLAWAQPKIILKIWDGLGASTTIMFMVLLAKWNLHSTNVMKFIIYDVKNVDAIINEFGFKLLLKHVVHTRCIHNVLFYFVSWLWQKHL